MKEEKEEKQLNLISLKFSVTGNPIMIDNVNINQPLLVSVQKALEKAGNTRPVEDYEVLYNNVILDINQKVETFGLLESAVLMVSLKTGQGGK